MTDATEQFRQFIIATCNTDPGSIIADGRWHRFNISDTRSKASKPGRYLMHNDERPVGHFMDWRDEKTRHRWFPDSKPISYDRSAVEAKRAARAAELQDGFAKAAKAAKAYWDGAVNGADAAAHPYVVAKGIRPCGARVRNGGLLVPLYSADGDFKGAQQISADGSRLYWKGMQVEGSHFLIGDAAGSDPIVLCEGYSTGASIHEATGFPVVVCIDAGNMVAVSRWAGHKWVGRDFIVAADDDWHLPLQEKPKPNKGRECGKKAALNLGARLVVASLLGLESKGGDDFNDVAREYDLSTVAEQINDVAIVASEIEQDQEQPAVGEPDGTVLGFTITDWSTDRYAGEAPPIRWLCEGSIPLAVPALFAAMGGVGKSFMALDMALEIASEVINGGGSRRILGGPIREHGSVVVLGAEDAKDSVHRRMAAIDPGGRREEAAGRLFVVPLPEVGGPMTLIGGMSGEFMQTAKLDALIEQLMMIPNLKLIVLDPLQAFVSANITSDPAAGQFMWSAFARICAMTGATLIACHHMRKEGSSTIETTDQAREAIRGSTALIDGARATYALWAASEDVTRRVCQEVGVEHRPKRVVNGAVVKANDEHDWEIHTYVRADNGLLTDANDAGKRAAQKTTRMTEAQCLDFLKTIESRWRAGRPFSAAANSQDRYAIAFMQRQYGVSKYVAKSQLDDWFHSEMVRSEIVDKKTKLQGLMVAKWPD